MIDYPQQSDSITLPSFTPGPATAALIALVVVAMVVVVVMMVVVKMLNLGIKIFNPIFYILPVAWAHIDVVLFFLFIFCASCNSRA